MSILVFGKTGQVASELRRFDNVIAVGRDQVDLNSPEKAAQMIMDMDVDAVINAAAYTAVDKAEDEQQLADIINCAAPKAMAKTAAQKGIAFVHISTDYVFDGQGDGPWKPADATAPIGAYGRSKNAGEIAVRDADGIHAILRTSWVFSAHGNNFVKTMLRLGAKRDQLSIVADQIGGPTAAADIAAACMKIANTLQTNPVHSGTYHFSGAPNVSWTNFAREIFAQSNLGVTVTDITSAEYPTLAVRPKNSRLDCTTTAEAFNINQPDWRIGLARVLKELREQT